MNIIIKYFFIILIFTKPSFSLDLKGDFQQGGLIIGKTNPIFEVFVQGEKVKINKEGFFIFGIPRDQIKDIVIKIQNKSDINQIVKKVKKRKFKIQRINGLPKRKVSPNEEDMKRIREEGKLIVKAKNVNSDLSYFFKGFIRPANGITTGVFGSQRILNGKPRRPHFGIDIAAAKGTKVINSNTGKVILAEKNLFFTGGTIIVEHGHGLISIYSHLEKILVKKGDIINKGKWIATVGSTGRSTGPHLDFRLYCRNIPVDPDLVIK
ncbi:MAG: peptidase [Candidatus Pelagibacter sp.]|nr:peptidase [Candidatus Pelagibacter sp.]OUV87730.1 MAG: peptidase [Pelagibacteraceae bacterium TMED136]|tara:strand:+ start:7581 stop:8375 length:795 start_codon:yes stop_codon:yes gene_type:complete